MKKEFSTLVRATLDYLQEDWGEKIPLKEKEPTPLPPSLPPPQPAPKKAVEIKPPTNWPLTPMPLPTEDIPQFTSFFHPIPLSIPIRLMITDPSQTFFLQGVARALTKLIAPAALYSGKLDPLLTHQNIQLVLAPLSLLKKRFPQVELHEYCKLEGPTLLPLADHYDIELKQTLWSTLKRFPNTPPSS